MNVNKGEVGTAGEACCEGTCFLYKEVFSPTRLLHSPPAHLLRSKRETKSLRKSRLRENDLILSGGKVRAIETSLSFSSYTSWSPCENYVAVSINSSSYLITFYEFTNNLHSSLET